MNAEPPPGNEPCAAFESERGVQGRSGSEFGSHRFMENHGARLSSKVWTTSWPGLLTVGSRCGSRGSRSIQVTSLAEPGREEMNRSEGSSWAMEWPWSSNRSVFEVRGSAQTRGRVTDCV